MSLTRWDPFRELEDMSQRLNRFFGSGALSRGQEQLEFPDWQPSVDISETADGFTITAELPEVKKEDIKVTLENGTLTLKGERRQEKQEQGKKFHRIERSYGSFLRSFSLPDTVDESKVHADVKDGVLKIQLQKSAPQKTKAVDVKIS